MFQTLPVAFSVATYSPRYDDRDCAHWEGALSQEMTFPSDEAASLAAELLAHWYNPEGDRELDFEVVAILDNGYWERYTVQTPRLEVPAPVYGDDVIPF